MSAAAAIARNRQVLEAMRKEIYQRSQNASRAEADVKYLEGELQLLSNELLRLIDNAYPDELDEEIETKECVYCAEAISEQSKVCPICGGIFLEHAYAVFHEEQKIINELGNEKM